MFIQDRELQNVQVSSSLDEGIEEKRSSYYAEIYDSESESEDDISLAKRKNKIRGNQITTCFLKP